MNLIINTDGASRGNPGKASYGYVIKNDSGVILHEEGKTLGVTTNNIAEYMGVLSAFEYINEHFTKKAPHRIQVIADSLLIISQLSGKFKIKNKGLLPIYKKIKELEPLIGEVIYKHVPRADNFLADRLANQALDSENNFRS